MPVGGWGEGAWGSDPWGGADDGSLQAIQAVASRENAVQVVFSVPVYFSGIFDVGDASKKAYYAVAADPNSRGLDGLPPRAVSVVSVAVVDAPGFAEGRILELTLDRPMSPSPSIYSVTVSPNLRTAAGDPIDAGAPLQFTGCHKQLAVQQAGTPSPKASRDFANPQTLSEATAAGNASATLGTFATDDTGDYALDSGALGTKKRILRRIITVPGAFVHLGTTYGAGALTYGKRLATSAARQQLVSSVETQVRQEPDVRATKATLQRSLSTPGLFHLVLLARTTYGQDLKVVVPVISLAA